MKSLWYRFINWLMKDTRNDDIPNNKKVKRLYEEHNSERVPMLSPDDESDNINKQNDRLQQIIAQKKNRKPFYKNDNKKDWE